MEVLQSPKCFKLFRLVYLLSCFLFFHISAIIESSPGNLFFWEFYTFSPMYIFFYMSADYLRMSAQKILINLLI